MSNIIGLRPITSPEPPVDDHSETNPKSSLVKVQDKLTVCPDHDLELKSLWASGTMLPWDTYSHESFRRFWDIRTVEHRK